MKIPTLVCLILCSCLSGCVIDTTSRTERSGRHVGPETLEQLQPGRTQEFVRGLLGDPASRSGAGEKLEVWTWVYSTREHGSGALIFVLDSDSTTEVRSTTYVLFDEGKLIKVWQD